MSDYSEASAHHDAFSTGYWAADADSDCPCHGYGWALSEVDTWDKCPIHFCGQLHPETECEDEADYNEQASTSIVEWAVEAGLASFTKVELEKRVARLPGGRVFPKASKGASDDDISF